jgi:hypothetical protein
MMDGWMIFSRFLLVWAAGPRVDILNSSFLRGPLQFIVLCCSKREFLFPFDFRKMNNTFNPFFLKKNNKLTSVSIITRSYHNQRVDANSLDKNHGKSTTTSSSSSASPGVVPGVTSRGSGALTTPAVRAGREAVPPWPPATSLQHPVSDDDPAAVGVAPPAIFLGILCELKRIV